MYKVKNNLKVLRVKNGLLSEDMAKLLNITRATYSAKENCKIDFNTTEIEKLKSIFCVSYEEIFFTETLHVL